MRGVWRISAALSSLKRFTEVELQAITSPGAAPISGAIFAPIRAGAPIQSAAFQLRTRPNAHSSAIARCSRSAAMRGAAPSELPSR